MATMDDNPIQKSVDQLLADGVDGEEIAAMLIEIAGDLAAAYTRSEEQCLGLCGNLGEIMVANALKSFRFVEEHGRPH